MQRAAIFDECFSIFPRSRNTRFWICKLTHLSRNVRDVRVLTRAGTSCFSIDIHFPLFRQVLAKIRRNLHGPQRIVRSMYIPITCEFLLAIRGKLVEKWPELINFQAWNPWTKSNCACVLANLRNCVESWVWKLVQLHDRLEFHKNPARFAVCVSLFLLRANFHSTSFSPRFLSLYGAFHSRFYLIESERDDGKYVLFTSGGSGIMKYFEIYIYIF